MLLSTRNAFPDQIEEVELATEAFNHACERYNVNAELSAKIMKIVSFSHLNGAS